MSVYSNKVKNKLMVMFFIKTMSTPLLGYQIEDYFLGNVLIELVELHSILAELTETGFLRTKQLYNGLYYVLTDKGTDALSNLEEELTETARGLIRQYCDENRDRIVRQNNVLASCEQNLDGGFDLSLIVLDNARKLMELKLSVDDEEYAVAAVKNWPERANDIYAAVLNRLFE